MLSHCFFRVSSFTDTITAIWQLLQHSLVKEDLRCLLEETRVELFCNLARCLPHMKESKVPSGNQTPTGEGQVIWSQWLLELLSRGCCAEFETARSFMYQVKYINLETMTHYTSRQHTSLSNNYLTPINFLTII